MLNGNHALGRPLEFTSKNCLSFYDVVSISSLYDVTYFILRTRSALILDPNRSRNKISQYAADVAPAAFIQNTY